MSDSAQAPADGHANHGSLKSYLIGFALSVVLTLIPFWMVMGELTDNVGLALLVIFSLGSAQILVHVYYFLHVDLKQEDGWQAMSLIFTLIILVIILAGSIWVMFHLHDNMMPWHDHMNHLSEGGSHGHHDH
ncbi:MAG: cytochrome o ubiquinol oxidase subunit IV [Pseudomonadota bacterium]